MDKMEYMLQNNPDATIGEYHNTRRLCEVPNGTDIRYSGRIYRVVRAERTITLKPIQLGIYTRSDAHMQFGAGCQAWVEVIPENKKPACEDKPAAQYSNRSPYGIATAQNL